jgi:hypothetical protein
MGFETGSKEFGFAKVASRTMFHNYPNDSLKLNTAGM